MSVAIQIMIENKNYNFSVEKGKIPKYINNDGDHIACKFDEKKILKITIENV